MAFGEERRVFYVGITRAKKHTWVLYDMNKPSAFVKEFVRSLDQETEAGAGIPESELCPKCRCGHIKVAKKGDWIFGCRLYLNVIILPSLLPHHRNNRRQAGG